MSGAPGPPPHPPADLGGRSLPVHLLPAGTVLHRIHDSRFGPFFFGPGAGAAARGRWESERGAFGVCYLAERADVAFAETFLRRPGILTIDEDDLAGRSLTAAVVVRDVRLAAVHGSGLARMGATGAVCSGPYTVSRAWAAALHAHPDRVDGIRYRARHDDDGFAVALFDRASGAVEAMWTAGLMERGMRKELGGWMDRYGVGLA